MTIQIDLKKTIGGAALVLLISAGAIILWENTRTARLSPTALTAQKEAAKYVDLSGFPLINKSVTADLGKHFIINFIPLRDQLAALQKKYAQKTYIYFLYLNNGSWIGLNERENFTAASTVKVPLAMALYKAVEDGKIDLNATYIIKDEDLDTNFGDLYKIGTGATITIKEAARIMLEDSDNTAKNIVERAMREIGITDPLESVYSFFGWIFDVGEAPGYNKINLKTLSNMFIALYNAKYNSTEHSQLILDHLSKTPFNDKIAADLPKTVTVSHKIGIADDDSTFSDCGIVYAPNRNYILCVGSNGGDEGVASRFIAEASKMVYTYVIEN